jgi:pimeloyl-ACP methyl ester carboxylesterase
MRSRRILTLAIVCVVGAGFAAAHFFAFGYGQCHPRRTVVTAALRARARETLPGLTEISFNGKDGATLRGWFAPPRNGTVLILVHGLGGNRASLLPEAEVFARHGYGILLFDSRAHGESGGAVATWGSTEAFDIAEAIRFVRAKQPVAHVALLGFSVGASAVARAAANDPTVDAVILYATWTSIREEIVYKEPHGGRLGAAFALLGFRYSGAQIDEIQPEADLARIAPRPLMFVSGGQDTDTPPRVMEHLYAVATGKKRLWILPEVGHGGYFEADPAEYERRVVGFLDESLAR